jgi:hypothetical protein
VTFTPSATGSQTGILTVNDGFTGTVTSPQSVQLFGVGTGSGTPSASATATPGTAALPPTLSPLVLNFGPQAEGVPSTPLAVTLTNNQNATLTIASITANNSQFAETDNYATVAPFGHCTISVTFTPSAIRSHPFHPDA